MVLSLPISVRVLSSPSAAALMLVVPPPLVVMLMVLASAVVTLSVPLLLALMSALRPVTV